MKCEHPIAQLVGMAEGIKCNVCGRLFLALDDVKTDKPIKTEKEKKTDD